MARYEPIDIMVKTVMGTAFVLEEIHPCETVRMLKLTIQDAHGLRYSMQNLVFGRTVLDDDEKELQQYGIRDSGCVLNLVMTLRGGPLNARRATSATSIEPETELVLELLDGTDVIGAVTLDEDVFDMLPGSEGKQFFVYFPGGEELPVDLQRLVYMDVDDYLCQYAEEAVGVAETPMYGGGGGGGEGAEHMDNPTTCHSPMCQSRARVRPYGSPKLRREQEERERMEVKVEHLRARMNAIRAVKKTLRDVDRQQQREAAAAPLPPTTQPSPAAVQARYLETTLHARRLSVNAAPAAAATAAARNAREERDAVQHERSVCTQTRAEGPTPLRACGGGRSHLDRLVLERSPDFAHCDGACEENTTVAAAAATGGGAAGGAAATGGGGGGRGNGRTGRRPSMPLPLGANPFSWKTRETGVGAEPVAAAPAAPYHGLLRDDSKTNLQHGGAAGGGAGKGVLRKARAKSSTQATNNGLREKMLGRHHEQPASEQAERVPAPRVGIPVMDSFGGGHACHDVAVQPLAAAAAKLPVGVQNNRIKLSRDGCEPPPPSLEPLHPSMFRSTRRRMSHDESPAVHLHTKHMARKEPTTFTLPAIHPSRAGQANVSNASMARQKLPAAAAAATVTASEALIAKTKEIRSQRQRCSQCGKKLTLAGVFTCRCGRMLCTKHRYPELHTCTYDYKTEGRKELKQANPAVHALKLPKI